MKLKTYSIEWSEPNSKKEGGICVIAATSEIEACEIAIKEGWKFTNTTPITVKKCYSKGEPRTLICYKYKFA